VPPQYSQRCLASIDRVARIPLIWCIAVTLLLASAYAQVRWSYVDTAVNLSAAADTRSWRELASDALTKSVEYRPMLDFSTRLAYRLLGLNLRAYQAIVVAEFALLLVMLVLLFRPTDRARAIAAVVALSVAVGLHTSRILFLFVPLNAYAAALLLVMGTALLVLTPRLRHFEWVFLPLTFIALMWLELGVLIVPMVIVAWWIKAPGTTWRSAAAVSAAFAVYLWARLGPGPGLGGMNSPDTGFGFSNLSQADSAALFGTMPWLFWTYNVGSTVMTVLASEPRAGTFRFVYALKTGSVPVWMWLHVVSSIGTTAVVFGALPGIRARPHRDRVIVALGAVLILAGSALAFLYTRDRIGLAAGFGYAMLVYVGFTAFLERQGQGSRRLAAVTLVAVLGLCWSIRTVEMYTALRDTAWDYHLEWNREDARAAAAQSPIVARMRDAAVAHRPASAEHDPIWTYRLFERRFEPAKEAP